MLIDEDGVLDLDSLKLKLWQVSSILKVAYNALTVAHDHDAAGDMLDAAKDIADSVSDQIGRRMVQDYV